MPFLPQILKLLLFLLAGLTLWAKSFLITTEKYIHRKKKYFTV